MLTSSGLICTATAAYARATLAACDLVILLHRACLGQHIILRNTFGFMITCSETVLHHFWRAGWPCV